MNHLCSLSHLIFLILVKFCISRINRKLMEFSGVVVAVGAPLGCKSDEVLL